MVSRAAYPPFTLCIEQRLVIIRVKADGGLFVVTEPVSPAGLERRLEELFRTRVERVAYVVGEPGSTFGQVAEVIDVVRRVAPNVGLLTPSTVPTWTEPLLRGAFPVKTAWN